MIFAAVCNKLSCLRKIVRARVFSALTFCVLMFSCTVEQEPAHVTEARGIDSVMRSHDMGYRAMHNDSLLLLKVFMTDGDVQHFRRRGFIADYLMSRLSTCFKRTSAVRLKIFSRSDTLIPWDTISYGRQRIADLRRWEKEEPVYMRLMTGMLMLGTAKYEELDIWAKLLSDTLLPEEKALRTFDPDFAYYLEKMLFEMYGQPPGFAQRKVMESFYTVAHDTAFKLVKPGDLLPLLDYADSVHYAKAYPKELQGLMEKRKKFFPDG